MPFSLILDLDSLEKGYPYWISRVTHQEEGCTSPSVPLDLTEPRLKIGLSGSGDHLRIRDLVQRSVDPLHPS